MDDEILELLDKLPPWKLPRAPKPLRPYTFADAQALARELGQPVPEREPDMVIIDYTDKLVR